jgi:uncharacterized protein YdhG (YjbR/CyaY superfamily)
MLKKATRIAPASVDAYLAAQSATVRATLEKVRKMIMSAAPKAEEVISYQIPTFRYHGPLVAFAAFPKHCSLYTVSHALMKELKEDLAPYYTSGVTIQFPPGKPLPSALVKKIVAARIAENEARAEAKNKKSVTKKKPEVSADAVKVDEYMKKLQHPLKAEIDTVRSIIKKSNPAISERIKWNAPSYYSKADMVTFNHRNQKQVHLVFHHPAIVKIKSPLLEGDYKDRRMLYLKDMKAIRANKKELERIMNELVGLANK